MGDADVVIVGAGAAGLCLAHQLRSPAAGPRPPSVVLLDAPPGPLRPPPRTWCFWEGERGDHDDAVSAVWRRLRVHGPDGRRVEGRPAPLRYKRIRSEELTASVLGRLTGRPGFRLLRAAVDRVRDVPGGAEVRGVRADGGPLVLRARWAYDSRPPDRLPAARTTLLQHFRGWFVRTARPAFDPRVAELMDFRTPQPADGLSFGYVLPTGECEALVEYTEFSPAVLDAAGYEAALRRYVGEVLRLGEYRITGVEQGVIPMTDGRFPRRAGASVFRIGTAGGATRPATGYTFAAVQRQSRAVAAAFRAGRVPVPPPPHTPRHRAMDAVLLRALAGGKVAGAELLWRLFAGVPTARLLRFLDGETRLWEDLSIGLHTPVRPMLFAAAGLPLHPRRVPPVPAAAAELPGPPAPGRAPADRRPVDQGPTDRGPAPRPGCAPPPPPASPPADRLPGSAGAARPAAPATSDRADPEPGSPSPSDHTAPPADRLPGSAGAAGPAVPAAADHAGLVPGSPSAADHATPTPDRTTPAPGPPGATHHTTPAPGSAEVRRGSC